MTSLSSAPLEIAKSPHKPTIELANEKNLQTIEETYQLARKIKNLCKTHNAETINSEPDSGPISSNTDTETIAARMPIDYKKIEAAVKFITGNIEEICLKLERKNQEIITPEINERTSTFVILLKKVLQKNPNSQLKAS